MEYQKNSKEINKRAKNTLIGIANKTSIMQNKLRNNSNLKKESLQVKQNKDGSFTFEWDKNDPSYNFLNNLTQEQIQSIIMSDMKSH